MRIAVSLLALSVCAVVALWAWLGAPVAMPHAPLQVGEKLYCLSYSPFRDGQSPFDETMKVSAAQIEDDLTRLAAITDCVRTYSVAFGQDQVAAIARRIGLKVIQGLWLGRDPVRNKFEIDTAIGIANRYPEVVRALVVGNEVLLRGDLSADDLAATIAAVKAKVKVPVTYADVWEYWLRNPQLGALVDFVTIHILPYWEDFPIAAEQAAAHVAAIHQRMAAAFPGKDILIGEVGWPSEGRMRAGALPSPVNQARVIQDVLEIAKRENFRVNVIEAFDQPWKRVLEGTVGGYWGLLDARTRDYKFTWGAPVSNHSLWARAAAGGAAFVVLVFAAGFFVRRGGVAPRLWLAVAVNAVAGGVLSVLSIAQVQPQSFDAGSWSRSLALAALAFIAPPLLSAATMRGIAMPPFFRVIAARQERTSDILTLAAGVVLIATMLLALQSALGLVFDPRYRDFPFAPLSAAAIPLLTHHVTVKRMTGGHAAAETLAAALLVLSAVYVAINEGFANWQSLWLCAAIAVLALILARSRDGQG